MSGLLKNDRSPLPVVAVHFSRFLNRVASFHELA